MKLPSNIIMSRLLAEYSATLSSVQVAVQLGRDTRILRKWLDFIESKLDETIDAAITDISKALAEGVDVPVFGADDGKVTQ